MSTTVCLLLLSFLWKCSNKSLKYTFQFEFSQFTDIVLHKFWVTRTSIKDLSHSCSGPTVSWTSWFTFHVHLWGHRVLGNKQKYKNPLDKPAAHPFLSLRELITHTSTPSLTSYRHKPEHETLQRSFTEGHGPSELTSNRLQASSNYSSDYCTQPWKKQKLFKLKIQD